VFALLSLSDSLFAPVCLPHIPELPIRLAKRIDELRFLPYGLSNSPEVMNVLGWYQQSLWDIISGREPENMEDEAIFTERLKQIHVRHMDVGTFIF